MRVVDFHCHSLAYRNSTFNHDNLESMLKHAKTVGIDTILLSEHLYSKGYMDTYRYLKKQYAYVGGRFLADGISIIPAAECSLKEQVHVVISGDYEALFDFRNDMRKNKLCYKSLLKVADSYEFILIGAHPCRKNRELNRLPKKAQKKLDFIELSGKDIKKTDLTNIYAKKLDKKLIAGSDANHPINLGTIYSIMDYPCDTVSSLWELAKQGESKIYVSSVCDYRNSIAKKMKRAQKNYDRLRV